MAHAGDRIVKVIVPYGAGGDLDTLARIFSEKMGAALNENWIVENSPGGNGRVGTNRVLQAKADGTTLLFSSSIHYIAPLVTRNLPYDAIADFVPIGPVVRTPMVMMASTALVKANTAGEVIAAMKAEPGKYTFAHPGLGASGHIAGLVFMDAAKVKGMLVPYNGTAQAITDVMAGSVSFVFMTPILAAHHASSSRLKPILTTASERLGGALKDVPTSAEVGLPALTTRNVYGFWGPKGMPAEEVARLSNALRKVSELPDVKRRLVPQGMQPTWEAPEVFAEKIDAEFRSDRDMLAKAGVKPE